MNNQEETKAPLKQSKDASMNQREEQIEGELLKHPEILERLLRKPEIKAVIRNEYFSGPLPPPNVLASYDKVIDGAAERILKMAEKEQQHRHETDSCALLGEINKDKRGQQFGFGIAILFGLIAFILGLTGQPWLGGIIATVDLVALVAVFVLGRMSVD